MEGPRQPTGSEKFLIGLDWAARFIPGISTISSLINISEKIAWTCKDPDPDSPFHKHVKKESGLISFVYFIPVVGNIAYAFYIGLRKKPDVDAQIKKKEEGTTGGTTENTNSTNNSKINNSQSKINDNEIDDDKEDMSDKEVDTNSQEKNQNINANPTNNTLLTKPTTTQIDNEIDLQNYIDKLGEEYKLVNNAQQEEVYSTEFKNFLTLLPEGLDNYYQQLTPNLLNKLFKNEKCIQQEEFLKKLTQDDFLRRNYQLLKKVNELLATQPEENKTTLYDLIQNVKFLLEEEERLQREKSLINAGHDINLQEGQLNTSTDSNVSILTGNIEEILKQADKREELTKAYDEKIKLLQAELNSFWSFFKDTNVIKEQMENLRKETQEKMKELLNEEAKRLEDSLVKDWSKKEELKKEKDIDLAKSSLADNDPPNLRQLKFALDELVKNEIQFQDKMKALVILLKKLQECKIKELEDSLNKIKECCDQLIKNSETMVKTLGSNGLSWDSILNAFEPNTLKEVFKPIIEFVVLSIDLQPLLSQYESNTDIQNAYNDFISNYEDNSLRQIGLSKHLNLVNALQNFCIAPVQHAPRYELQLVNFVKQVTKETKVENSEKTDQQPIIEEKEDENIVKDKNFKKESPEHVSATERRLRGAKLLCSILNFSKGAKDYYKNNPN